MSQPWILKEMRCKAIRLYGVMQKPITRGESPCPFSVANGDRGWETWLRPDQIKTEFQRVLHEVDPTHPERWNLQMTCVEMSETQARKKENQNHHLQKLRSRLQKGKGDPEGGEQAEVPSDGSHSGLESLPGPRGPGALSCLCFL